MLIFDEHEVVRAGLRAFLSRDEAIESVADAHDAEDAFRLARDLDVDVVLMEFASRDGDAGAIRRISSARPEARVIVLTRFSDEARIHAALEAGARGYLLKDILPADLLKAIRDASAGYPALHPVAQNYLLKSVLGHRRETGIQSLTSRQLSVLSLVGSGLKNAAIASELSLAHGTVKGHMTRIFETLNVRDRTEAALIAFRSGLAVAPQAASSGRDPASRPPGRTRWARS